MGEIQRKIIDLNGRSSVSQLFHAKSDKETIATWRLDLGRILGVFNVDSICSCLNTINRLFVDRIGNEYSYDRFRNSWRCIKNSRRNRLSPPFGTGDCYTLVITYQDTYGPLDSNQVSSPDYRRIQLVKPASSVPGESPPPPPRVCFGRDDLIEEIVGLAENLTPTALIGTGGIGKTSIALTVLHHNRIKQRFGDDRRFIRCDQFPASRAHFLDRLSKVIGAGVENPGDLTPLRPFLSSKQIFIILDNAESILDPQGVDAQELYTVVEELSQLGNICLCITSRISTVPPDCERVDVPTLSIEAACDVFYRIYRGGERSDLVNNILDRLDFHPLSIILLATVAFHNTWDYHRLAREWEKRRTGVLRTRHNKSLAAAIELSLSSPMFQGLGSDARALLDVVAFFPQGIDENKCDWFFPTISDVACIFDQFCVLSLTHRNNGFITMLAPLRDYIGPKDPYSSRLLCAIKERYFLRLLVDIYPDKEGYEETKWIISEDVNVEHLLDVLLSINASSPDVLEACVHFMEHLYWHKRRLVVLGPKIEGIPDDHPSKPRCLYQLSWLFQLVGNDLECRRLLIYALELSRERRDDVQVAKALRFLADANRLLGHHEEGILQAKEALEIDVRLNDTTGQVHSLRRLAELLYDDKQLGAAEEVAYRAINLLSDNGSRFLFCQCHRILGLICRSKGKVGKAIDHLNVALRIASPFNWHDQLFWIHYALAGLFHEEGRADEADASIERAKSHAVGDACLMGRAIWLQGWFWFQRHKLEEARYQALLAVEIYERIGAVADLGICKQLIQLIDGRASELITHRDSGEDSEFVEVAIYTLLRLLTVHIKVRVPDDGIYCITRPLQMRPSASDKPFTRDLDGYPFPLSS